jgi:hypothetical protein
MKIKNLFQIILAALIVFFSFRYVIFAKTSKTTPIDSMMTEDTANKTGIYKLTPSEKNELKIWIDQNYLPIERQTQSRYTTNYRQYPVISEVTSNGNFIMLDDKTTWQIYPSDTPVTSGWLIPVPIIVEYEGNGEYPYTLKNTVTESKVRARKVTHIPESPLGYFKDILNHFKRKGIGLNIII